MRATCPTSIGPATGPKCLGGGVHVAVWLVETPPRAAGFLTAPIGNGSPDPI